MIDDLELLRRERPECMRVLGLRPPYALQDIRLAYKQKARAAHPDGGGSPEAFIRVQQAYENAMEYVNFDKSRRGWLAAHVERYIDQEKFVADIEGIGGEVELEFPKWRQQAFGEFSQIAGHVVGLRLLGPQVNGDSLRMLSSRMDLLGAIRLIDLGGSSIVDADLDLLAPFRRLISLDVRNTKISMSGIRILKKLKHLELLHVGGTSISWWQRRLLACRYRHLQILTSKNDKLSASRKSTFSSVAEMAVSV